MMQKRFYKKNPSIGSALAICASLLIMLLSSCASTPSPSASEKPLWVNLNTQELVFPRANYIARTESADTANTAAVLAEAELVSHFSHSVSVNTKAIDTRSLDSSGSATKNQTINQEINIRASMELFAIHKTKPWYDKDAKTYYVCAYIDREEAWELYRPHIEKDKKAFRAFFDNAEKESDVFKKIKILHAAEESSLIFEQDLEFARLLSPKREAEYESDRAKLAKMGEMIARAKIDASMKVQVKNDNSNKIARLVTALLSGEGYYLSDRNFAYMVNVTVEKNLETHKDGEDTIFTSEPGLNIIITNGTEILFSYNKSFSRISGFSEAFINKKLYAALEEEISNTFIREFKAALE